MKIIKKEIISYKGQVIDLKIKNDPSYNIGGVVVHNSAGGSLLSYALDVTEIDPIQFGLYFERFLNPDRTAKPDIDFDCMQGSREKIREYLEGKYGKESVLGVCTYQLYQSNSALSDVSRGLGKDTSFTSPLREALALQGLNDEKDLVSFFKKTQESSSCSPTLLKWILDNQDTIKWAQKLKGQFKNLGTHAGGIVITPGPIYDYIPVAKGGGEIVTAFRESDGSAKDLSELGILKLDILGLKTLNVLQDSINDIKKDLGIDITNDIKYVKLDDPKLYERFGKGNNIGIFQMAGCLDKDTLVLKSSNTQEKIKNLKTGDKIISYNEETKVFEEDTIIRQFNTGIKKGFKISFEENVIICSEEHRFLTKSGWKKAYELKEGDDILSIVERV